MSKRRRVEILCGTPGREGAYIKYVYDQARDKYFAPIKTVERMHEIKERGLGLCLFSLKSEYKRDLKEGFVSDALKKAFDNKKYFLSDKAKITQKDDKHWSMVDGNKKYNIEEKNTKLNINRNIKIAIVDTGMMLNHPFIRDIIEESVDFTGEGVEDLNGHGTMMALIAMTTDIPILNVKVADSEGRGSVENLIKGIQWLTSRSVDAELIANFSLGVYWKKWGIFKCKGDCKVCRAAENAANQGVAIVAAAGKIPGQTCCPAKLGVAKRHPFVLATTTLDFDHCGKGTIATSGKRPPFVQIN